MSWRFRKSFSPLPGVRVTLSKSGISTSVGNGPFRATLGPRGTTLSARVPGSGLSYQKRIPNIPKVMHGNLQLPENPSDDELVYGLPVLSAINSVDTEMLTTPGLTEFKRLLEAARTEYASIIKELVEARKDEASAVGRFDSWKYGWVRRTLFKAKFELLTENAQIAKDKRAELEEQEQLAKLQTQIIIPENVSSAYKNMIDEFEMLAHCEQIWDTVGHRAANQIAERTLATRTINREPVLFHMGSCKVIDTGLAVPHLENANGGDIYFYPAFVLYFTSSENFALLEYKDISLVASNSNFMEEDSIPCDANVIGNTWAKVNKDGSPDKRFKDNYQIPIVEYGKIVITSRSGMNEEYMISNIDKSRSFFDSWQKFNQSIT